jgi:hypothetical protein
VRCCARDEQFDYFKFAKKEYKAFFPNQVLNLDFDHFLIFLEFSQDTLQASDVVTLASSQTLSPGLDQEHASHWGGMIGADCSSLQAQRHMNTKKVRPTTGREKLHPSLLYTRGVTTYIYRVGIIH